MALQSLILPILSVFRSAGLQQASGVLNRLSGNFDSLAGKIGLAAGSFSAFSALTAARQFTIDSVNATAQFERNILGLNQVFEDVTPQIRGFIQQVESYGLSQAQAAQASVFLGSVLKQYGLTTQESADQTQRLVTLAQDLATTYGYDLQTALLAITALFRGEYDPIEKFGVAMKQSEVNARLAAEGLGDLKGEELALAQANARLTMLFERADDAVGAFTRASDTLYVSQQKLNAVMGNLQVAFGTPLQKPLAEINNIFADLAQKFGPEVVDISEAIGQTIEIIGPLVGELGESFLTLVAALEQVVDLLNLAFGAISALAVPLLDVVNTSGKGFIQFLDTASASIDLFLFDLAKVAPAVSKAFGAEEVDLGKLPTFFSDFIVDSAEKSVKFLELMETRMRIMMNTYDEAGVTGLNAGRRMSAGQIQAALAATKAAEATTYYQTELQKLGVYSKDAEGKLTGLADVFVDIENAAKQSEASEALLEIGFSAGQIEQILTRPDWAAIFGEISRLARIAAIDISKVTSVTGLGIIGSAQAALDKLREEAFKPLRPSTTNKAAKDTVKTFFDTMKEEIQKQTIREALAVRGASKGLIEAILNADEYMKLWIRIKQGKLALQELQDQFNKTAGGARELAAAFEETKRQQEEYDEKVRAINDRLAEELQRIAEKAAAAKQQFADLLETFVILPTIEREVGRFEGQVVQMLQSVEQALRDAFRNKDILEAGYQSLREYARKELSALQEIARQRDELVKRYDLASGLIDNYKRAFTAAMSLTSLFGRLRDETEKRTVTVVTSGIVRLGASLREFGVTITKSFEEPVQAIQNKTQALLGEFRTMADKARSFAENLRKLKQLGLDPMLFNELVEAGVVAGGETAQALVDGGSETVNEINTLFGEINALGADLGEEVAATMYGTGIDMADGLLNGIRSKQQELEELARSMAEAFNREFQSLLNIQIDIAAKAASDAARAQAAADIAALGPRPELPELPKLLDNNALAQLDTLIRNANRYAGNIKDQTKQLGALAKLDIYEQLRDAVRAGATVDMSQIRSGMSTAALQAAAAQAAPTVVNNFNVAPGNTMQQYQTVETLRQFVNQNGSLVSYGIQ